MPMHQDPLLVLYWKHCQITVDLGDGKEINSNMKHSHAIFPEVKKSETEEDNDYSHPLVKK